MNFSKIHYIGLIFTGLKRYVYGSLCLWFIKFITRFDKSLKKIEKPNNGAKIGRMNFMGLSLITELLPAE